MRSWLLGLARKPLKWQEKKRTCVCVCVVGGQVECAALERGRGGRCLGDLSQGHSEYLAQGHMIGTMMSLFNGKNGSVSLERNWIL